MRIKSLFVSLIIILQCASTIAATPPKAGAPCTKIGITQNYGGKKFTCIKSGKNLIWDKGLIIKVATTPITTVQMPAQTVLPTPITTPTPIPNTSSTESSVVTATPKTDTSPTVGSSCKTQGEIIDSKGIKLVCRLVVNQETKYFELTDVFVTQTNPKSPDSFSTCHLTDQRPKPVQPEGTQITFPIIPREGSVKSGIEKIAIVGFDFSDSIGSGTPLDVFGNTMETSQQFFTWYSNGKVKFEFTSYDKWIRLSKPSTSYVTGPHFTSVAGALTVSQMVEEFRTSISKYISLNGFTAVWFVYPKNVQAITENFGYASNPSFYGFGPGSYQTEVPLWTYFIHEMLHEQGLQGHSPKEPYRFGVLLNGNGYTAGMNSWDELSVDWITEEEIYCIEKSHLKPVQIDLAPIERQQGGVHTIMIKLDDHRALVIESHRRGDFAPGMPEYGYGVTIQLVDTTKATTWDDEKATSEYLKISSFERRGPEYGTRLNNEQANYSGINDFNGIGVSGARWGLDQNYFLLEGEKYIFEGITITFSKSGNTDSINLS